jgi:hypothetical protein
MNNLQLATMLDLWKERVVEQAERKRADVLRLQLDEIRTLKEFRDALVHGMWHWTVAEPTRISTVRVRRKQVITTHFNVTDLQDFADRVANINFKIRYLGGLKDLAAARGERGSGISRMGLAILSGAPVIDDWLSARSQHKGEKAK